MLYFAIIGDIVFQVFATIFYVANRKRIAEMAISAFYGKENQLHFGVVAYCLIILCVWFTYCFMVHNTAPVLMGGTLSGWAEFVFLYLPTLIIPIAFSSKITAYYIEFTKHVEKEFSNSRYEKTISEMSYEENMLKIRIKELELENQRLRSEIGKIQDAYQNKKMSKKYYSLSDIIRSGLYKDGVKLTEYAIRKQFEPNDQTIFKSSTNDNGIFIRQELMAAYFVENGIAFTKSETPIYFFNEYNNRFEVF